MSTGIQGTTDVVNEFREQFKMPFCNGAFILADPSAGSQEICQSAEVNALMMSDVSQLYTVASLRISLIVFILAHTATI